MNDVRAEIEPLQTLLHTLQSERDQLESRLAVLHRQPVVAKKLQTQAGPSRSAIDYQTNSFPWSDAIIPRAKFIFDIAAFRLCQAGVVNAAMDGRDIVCVMPTGGGKSLTYQLPAVMGEKGLTVVVSPLLALIWDQVRALKEIGVEAVVSSPFAPTTTIIQLIMQMLTGSTSKDEQNRIFQKMERGGGGGEKELRVRCSLSVDSSVGTR
jgi:ATP-dependent DNA helicase Q1